MVQNFGFLLDNYNYISNLIRILNMCEYLTHIRTNRIDQNLNFFISIINKICICICNMIKLYNEI